MAAHNTDQLTNMDILCHTHFFLFISIVYNQSNAAVLLRRNTFTEITNKKDSVFEPHKCERPHPLGIN